MFFILSKIFNFSISFTDNLKQNEFIEKLPVDEFLGNKEQLKQTSTTRRDFLKFLGFSTAAASIAACEAPVRKAIPYVVKPEELMSFTLDLAHRIASGPSVAIELAKKLVKESSRNSLETQVWFEAGTVSAVSNTFDRKEGISSFLERRNPEFRGE